jgi:DNA helicase-2/ATP-dependent DNA helicase PcrA
MGSGEIPLLNITHLIGDEMQDADEVQLEFILNHTRKGVVTTLVADDDQTIYEWRCALGYAGLQYFAAQVNAKTITLGENFRSREEVVAHARELIANNDPDRVEKNQIAVRGAGGVLGVVKSATPFDECEAVAVAIRDYKYDDEEIAVLARSNRALDRMEEALAAEGIPYRRDGPTLWDTPEIALLLAVMRALISSRTAELLPVLMLLHVDPDVRKELETSNSGRTVANSSTADVPDLAGATDLDGKVLQKFVDGTSDWRKLLRSGDYNLVIPDIGFAVAKLLQENRDSKASATKTRRINQLTESAVNVLTKLRGFTVDAAQYSVFDEFA